MKVNYNLQAAVAQRCLKGNEDKLKASTGRLSSGYKINRAKDDAAGLAISKRMYLQIKGLDRASENTQNGISVCESADGVLAEVQDMLQRMKEISVKAANGTNTTSDRKAIEAEVKLLKEEITRITEQTDFNDGVLLDGTYDLRGYADKLGIKITNYTDEVPVGKYTIEIDSIGDEEVDPVKDAVVRITAADAAEGGTRFVDDAFVSAEGNEVTITDNKGKTITFEIDPELYKPGADKSVVLDITGIGAYSVQVGSNEGQLLDMRIPEVSLKTLGIEDADVTTQEKSRETMTMMDDALETLSIVRSKLGAYQNRLEHTASSLAVTTENMTEAVSRISDLDMSEEMVDYTTLQVLVQAGTSMLAQANTQPEQALQLLQ